MSLKKNGRLSRREMLQALTLAAGGSSTLGAFLTGCREGAQSPADRERFGTDRQALDKPPKFLIVIGASGGASIIDSFLAIRGGEAGANAGLINTFPDADVLDVAGSPLRAVKVNAPSLGAIPVAVKTDQSAFVAKHKQDILVATSIGTSVNHVIAQKRSLTGNAAFKGRTLQECVAKEYGAAFAIPNVNMGVGGYLERGTDDDLPAYCYSESVGSPALWPLGLDSSRGIKGAPDRELIALAQKVRNEQLDPESVFAKTFARSPRLQRWYASRGSTQSKLEALDLITKLNVLPDMPPQIPLNDYGLGTSPDGAKLRAAFPNFFTDPFEGQAALAFLLLKNRVSVSVTIGPSFNVVIAGAELGNPPLAFDFSHNDHRAGQAFMWSKIMNVCDKLIDLLKAEPYDATSGQSMWDHSLIYVATDFGRTKPRPNNATQFGTGHDLNNGFLMMSPLLKGNAILGGVDKATGLSYGFDTETGAPLTGKTTSNEPEIFSGILHTLGVDTTGSGLPDCKAFRKA
ncbi:MAG: DUF1501 domain-containing protein [Myxococcaceae bacterium]|nr:DUF1501 domain-containing protein [Myxococcaceae bacterium]